MMNQSSTDDEALHLDLLKQSVDLIWRANPQGEFTFFSPSLKAITGFEPEDLLHKPLSEYGPIFLTEESLEITTESLKNRLDGKFGDEPLTFDLTFKRKDGTQFIGEMRTSPILSPTGQTIGIQGTTRDVSEHRRMVKELEKSKELFLMFFKLSNDPCCITKKASGEIIDVNPSWQTVFGWTREDAIGKRLTDLNILTRQNQEELDERLNKTLDPDPSTEYRVTLCTKSGEERSCLLDCRTVGTPGKENIFTLIEDITDKEALEKEQLRLGKLESLGIFAGGIAHEVNNSLTEIIGNLSMAKISDNTEERNGFLENSETASLQIRSIAQQILTFSKGGEPARELIELEDLLVKAVPSSLHGSNIKAEFIIEDDIWQVKIDKEQIKQVIHNVVVNARQAMSGEGSIFVSIKNIQLTTGTKIPVAPGSYVQVSIGDQGSGIAAADQQKIFDPFYSTKSSGKGLGLAVSHSIIQKHHGHITFASHPNIGTTFSFLLPAEKEKSPIAKKPKQLELRSGKGKILVMDDSEPIQLLIKAMLSRLGYDVVVTSDGSEAIEEYKTALDEDRSFLAVILDLTVPGGVGGEETLRTLLQVDPHVKAIVASGYSDSDVLSQYQNYGFSGSIPKPFRVVELGAALDKVINSAPPNNDNNGVSVDIQ